MRNIDEFLERSEKKANTLSLMDRISYDFRAKMRKIFDLYCHCELCLRFCEPPDDAKV